MRESKKICKYISSPPFSANNKGLEQRILHIRWSLHIRRSHFHDIWQNFSTALEHLLGGKVRGQIGN